MTARAVPEVDCQQHHPSLSVGDVLSAVEFYTTKLGFKLGFTWGDPLTIAGVNLGGAQLFLEKGTPSPDGCAVYFVIGNADQLHDFHSANGVEVHEDLGDRPWGIRDYTVKDLNGYKLTFGHHTYTDGPPVAIERVELPVRIEKRLAAVLRDLAAFKKMSLSSCLEETLLHTFEPLEDGVASPHTKTDIRYIQELKKRHGIDYDCHASYRFVER